MERTEVTVICPECGQESTYGVDPNNPEDILCAHNVGWNEATDKPINCPHVFSQEDLGF